MRIIFAIRRSTVQWCMSQLSDVLVAIMADKMGRDRGSFSTLFPFLKFVSMIHIVFACFTYSGFDTTLIR